jgi:hypothetical protein
LHPHEPFNTQALQNITVMLSKRILYFTSSERLTTTHLRVFSHGINMYRSLSGTSKFVGLFVSGEESRIVAPASKEA